jgi:putative DNA primase/helicase
VIFKWLLDGYEKYKKHGLKEPKSVKNAVLDYEKRNDRVALFVDEMCELVEDARIGRTELYSSYKTWCRTNGLNAKSAQKFYDDMDKHAAQKIISGVRLYQGVKLRNVSNFKIK